MAANDEDVIQDASAHYVGQWNRLVSTTNWEKGRIILAWREEVVASGAPSSECSDETWARRVGGVSPQHVGRLRRVCECFGAQREQFPGLFWSHFFAALDWDDAVMWLEGAVHSGWSVAAMKRQRWEALGAPADLRPSDEDVICGEFDEDAPSPLEDRLTAKVDLVRAPGGSADLEGEAERDEEDDAETDGSPAAKRQRESSALNESPSADEDGQAGPAPRRLFENLPELPDDLAGALEELRLAILRHKLSGWQAVSRDDLLAWLDAIRELAAAPVEASS